MTVSPSLPSKPNQTDSSLMILQRREFSIKGELGDTQIDFDFFVVNNSGDWRPASSITGSFDISTIGSNRVNRVELHGISYRQYEEIEITNPIPDPPEDESGNRRVNDPKYLSDLNDATLSRKIAFIEASSGMKIPGENKQEKFEFMKKRCGGELEALVAYIISHMACNNNGDLLRQYNQAMSDDKKSKLDIIKIGSFDDWQEASDIDTRFVFQHPTDQHITELPLRAISLSTSTIIEEECKIPEPPLAPRYVNGRRTQETYRNYRDPSYRERARLASRRRNLMLIKACLCFDIPGASEKEQIEWLLDRPFGDINNLTSFIEGELVGYGSRLDFFTKGLDLQS